MKAQTLTFSKTATILKCCLIALAIACLISVAGKVDARQFMQNILEWESI